MKIIDEGIKNPAKYGPCPELTEAKLREALDEALKKIDANLEVFSDKFPSHNSTNNVYEAVENTGGWNQGFWTGILWLAYELTGDEKYRKVAEGQIPSYAKRIKEKLGVNHHDMGFLYIPSCVAAYKLTGNEEAKEAAILAADNLMTRYHEKGRFIQAWGNIDDKASRRLIIDCLMNIPLLFWASEVTGEQKYHDVAYDHFLATTNNIIREDASTYHTFYFNPETGEPEMGKTAQGYSDDSCWSRGQAWGMYGHMLTYIYKKNPQALEAFKKTTNYFLNRMPEDYVAYWDLIFTDGDEERDSSASAIGVCGILEALKWMDDSDPLKEIYDNASKHIVLSLYENYSTKDTPESNGLLLHAVYGKPQKNGVDECNIWGDYYYMEALARMLMDWKLYS